MKHDFCILRIEHGYHSGTRFRHLMGRVELLGQTVMNGTGKIFVSATFARALGKRPLVALDIGARRGFISDLLPIASVVDAVGLEPDRGECERLNRAAQTRTNPWRSLRYLPVGLAKEPGQRELHLIRTRGTSSMLSAIPGIDSRYMREKHFAVESTLVVDTQTLDDTIVGFNIGSPAYLKIDVEGMEKEVFESAERALRNVLAVRTEVTFTQTRYCQPL